MGRKRRSNKELPRRVYFKHGAYYYVVDNKWIFLSKQKGEALRVWSTLIDKPEKLVTMKDLFDRYLIEVAPLKASNTYKANVSQMPLLERVFGHCFPDEIYPQDIYKYLDYRAQQGSPIAANREKSLLSHVFSMAIRWGAVKDNPCRHVKRLPEKPRDRYVTDEEFLQVQSIALPVVKSMMELAYLTGQRSGDLLNIKFDDMSDRGILIKQSKTGKSLLIEWTDRLKECIDSVKTIREEVKSNYLFCTRHGKKYTADGFSSLWQKTIILAVKKEKIKERFTFHDIRAKSASDSETTQLASELLGHSDSALTNRVYRRKETKVRPIK